MKSEKLIFEKSQNNRKGVLPPEEQSFLTSPEKIFSQGLLRKHKLPLPCLSELDVIRHYTRLSQLNFSVDTHFYPLGSCTMKYNPKISEELSMLEEFKNIHPYQQEEDIQGILELMFNLEKILCEITGMHRFCLQPSAGAHGELTGMLIIGKYHRLKKHKKTKVLVPDSSHGTNPASASMCGYKVIEIKSNSEGLVDIDELNREMDDEVACLMLTNPNTLGLFEEKILDIKDIVHKKGGLLYYDGANLNALLGICKIRDMGFDVIHMNLHKTFSTPHGGGGPGAGPVGVTEELVEFLPVPLVEKNHNHFILNYKLKNSIGRVRSFYANIPVLVKAYSYILRLGKEGLKRVALYSVLNANYIREKLKSYYNVASPKPCMHEVVFSAIKQKQQGVSALDIAKKLIDEGIHPPTIYFPLIVQEALMIEPTETENKETLDYFIEIMIKIAKEAETSPENFKNYPKNTPVSRLDETQAARNPILKWQSPPLGD